MNDGGKGSKQRPTDQGKFRELWEKIFGDKRKPVEPKKEGQNDKRNG